MVSSPDGDRVLCPACGDPWQDRGGIIRKSICPDCGQVILLTEQHRSKTIICPKCRSLLGCLIDHRGRKWGGRSTILDFMALAAAFALGYASALALWAQHVPRPLLNGVSVVVLPITWTLVALRFIGSRPSRRRRFDPPGLSACVAVSAASLLNSWYAWDSASIRTSVAESFYHCGTSHRGAAADCGCRGGYLGRPYDPRPEMASGAELDRSARAMPGNLLARGGIGRPKILRQFF